MFTLTWEKDNPDYWTRKTLKSKFDNVKIMHPGESNEFYEWYKTALEEIYNFIK